MVREDITYVLQFTNNRTTISSRLSLNPNIEQGLTFTEMGNNIINYLLF